MSDTAATDLRRMSAMELAGMIRSGQASSREVIETHLPDRQDVRAPHDARGNASSRMPFGPPHRTTLCLTRQAARSRSMK